MGSHIMVGFMVKTKTEKAKRTAVFLFWIKISFKMISEKIITGKSGLGDWENNSRTGMKHRWIHVLFSVMYKA